MTTICLKCGDEGWANAFVYCIECLEFALHRYCLDTIPKTVDEFVHWVCEDCKKEMPNHITIQKPIDIIKKNRNSSEINIRKGPEECNNCGKRHGGTVCLKGKRICYNCRKKGHISINCPNPRSQTCYNCGPSDHLVRNCPKERKDGDKGGRPPQLTGQVRQGHPIAHTFNMSIKEAVASGNVMSVKKKRDGTTSAADAEELQCRDGPFQEISDAQKHKRAQLVSNSKKKKYKATWVANKHVQGEFVHSDYEDSAKEMPNPTIQKPVAILKKKRYSTCFATEAEEQKLKDARLQEIFHAQRCKHSQLVRNSKEEKHETHGEANKHEQGHLFRCSQQALEAIDCSSMNGAIEKLTTDSVLEERRRSVVNTGSNSESDVSYLGSPTHIQQEHQIPAEPIEVPVWRGDFSIINKGEDTYDGFLAHVSNKACSRVWEEAKLLKPLLHLEMLPKSDVWPKSFEKSDPSEESIALYFFPADISSERVFDDLVNYMINNELALKAMVKNAELLLFTSTELPLLYWRFQGKYYLWGVFRGKQASQSTKSDDDASCLDPATDKGTAVKRNLKKTKTTNAGSPVSPLSGCHSYVSCS